MDEQNLPLGMVVGKMMRELFRVLNNRMENQMDIKLPFEQFGLLHAINASEEEAIQKDMACMMGKDKSTILRLTNSLEKKELVRKVMDVNDRRKNYLMVTKKGEKVLDHKMQIVYDLMDEVEDGLTESDLQTFYKVVSHIKEKAEKM